MSANFKTCMFGGFDREDVIAYIEKTAKESRERIDALEAENESFRLESQRMDSSLRALQIQAEEYSQTAEERDTLRLQLAEIQAQVNSLRGENASLRQENEALRGAAAEAAHLKEHIADIEISAHRRTEEFRAEAIAKLRRYIEEQRNWCQEQRGQYAAIVETILQDGRRAGSVLENSDFSGFDTMAEALRQLEDTLQ